MPALVKIEGIDEHYAEKLAQAKIGGQTGDVLAAVYDAPGCGPMLASDHVEQRGLARAIRSDEPRDAAFGNRERTVAHGLNTAEILS